LTTSVPSATPTNPSPIREIAIDSAQEQLEDVFAGEAKGAEDGDLAGLRSRIDMAMVLAQTSKVVKITAPQMLMMNALTLPRRATK